MTPQYRTTTGMAAWFDASARGRIRFEGPDAAAFLHALVTNDVTTVSPGRGAYAAWLTPQGRMITDLRLLRDADAVVAEVPRGTASALVARFDQLIFAEDVRVIDDSESTRQAIVFGEQSASVIAALTGGEPQAIADLPTLGHLKAGDLRVVRHDDIVLPNYAIWMPVARWDSVVSTLRSQGAINESGTEIHFDALRIEAGRPLFGVDMTTDTIPLEAGLLDRAISQSKGCYVGQEVIVRILHRGGGRVVKQLVKLVANAGVTEVPAIGTTVLDEGREVGKVTSATIGPTSGLVVALAFVHRDSAVPGRSLALESGHEVGVEALAG